MKMIRGKGNAPPPMREMRQGLFDIARKLVRYADYRAKWMTVYLTTVDEDGNEARIDKVRIDKKGDWTSYTYRSAADEHGA